MDRRQKLPLPHLIGERRHLPGPAPRRSVLEGSTRSHTPATFPDIAGKAPQRSEREPDAGKPGRSRLFPLTHLFQERLTGRTWVNFLYFCD